MNHPVTITSNRRIGVRRDVMFSFTNEHVDYYSYLPETAVVGDRIYVISKLDDYGHGHSTWSFDGKQWQQI